MRVRRMITALFAAAAVAMMVPGVALAATAGDENKGDVWVDNVGQPAGPGHEMDPHLQCQDINLWGSALADASGTYTVDGWEPSGSGDGDQAWPGTKASPSDASWAYDQTAGGSQVISVITVKELIDNAVANGDTPQAQQGYHFKLQFSQDPQKHKTFWVECTPAGEQLPLDCDGDTDGSVLVNGVCDGTPPASAVQAASTAPSLPHAGSGPGTSPMVPLAVMAAVALAVGGGLLLVLHLGRRQRI